MVISLYKAQDLFARIARSELVALHSYQARWTRSYVALDRLDFFTMPRLQSPRTLPGRLIASLNTFAGQLFISSHQDHRDVCDLLA